MPVCKGIIKEVILMTWLKTGNDSDVCVYWTNRSKSESQIVIMNTNEFYSMYRGFDKHNTKKKGFELSISPQYSNFRYKKIIGCYTTFEEAYNIAIKIMLNNPDRIPYDFTQDGGC